MIRKSLLALVSLGLAIALAAAPNTPPTQPMTSATEIVNKNVAARGGLETWRGVQTMSLTGKLGAGGNRRATLPSPLPNQGAGRQAVPARPTEEAQLPFLMDLARPRKMRMELQFNGQTAVQVFDGANGWKLRPFLNRLEIEQYTPDEMKKASLQAGLDGYLVDYAAKGTTIELIGMEKVEGRDAYKLKLTMRSGEALHVWIDAQTFLEAKLEGQPRRLDGRDHPVEIYFRDYRPVNGLQIPFVLETKVLPAPETASTPGLKETPVPAERITIEKVLVNPKLDDALFTKASLQAAVAAPAAGPAAKRK